MNRTWKLFLIFRLPLAIMLLGMLTEITAHLLSTTPKLRHPLDHLVANIDKLPGDAKAILLGDSVTQDVALRYELAPANSFANLTTNQASGVIGSYLLLRRYLKNHTPPRRIIISSTPEFFSYSPTPQSAEIYLSSVFESKAEIDELKSAGIPVTNHIWKPAILDFENRIFDRISGLFFANSQITNKRSLPKRIRKDAIKDYTIIRSDKYFEARATSRLSLSGDARFAVEKICALSRIHKIEVVFVWAPTPATVLQSWKNDDRLRKLTNILKAASAHICFKTVFVDINQTVAFPNHAFRDRDHLRRPYWTMLYAQLLRDLISKEID